MTFSHVIIGARDVARLADFYDIVLAPLGLVRTGTGRIGELHGWAWWLPGRRWPKFCIEQPLNGLPATSGNGGQVSFAAPDRAAVDAAWQAALAAGGADEGAPGIRAHYSPDFYGAYCRDPEGNKLCFLHAGGLF